MEENKTMVFGKTYIIGNYPVVKKVRSIGKRELRDLRAQSGIPADVQKHLQRGGLPFIVVQTVSGSWSIAFVCGLKSYALLDFMVPRAVVQQDDPQEGYEDMTVGDLSHLFNMWYTDTNVLGDREFQEDKAKAFAAYMKRVQAPRTETPEEKAADDKVLEELKAEEDAKATIVDMAEHLKKEGGEE